MRRLIAIAAVLLLIAGPTRAASVPAELNGLAVAPEHVGKPERRTDRPEYLSKIELFSLRAGQDLQATLQIGRFRDDAPLRQAGFRRRIVSQLATSVPLEQHIGGTTVWLTREKKLDIVVWFRDRHMFVLSIRDTYDRPKSLVRAALEVDP